MGTIDLSPEGRKKLRGLCDGATAGPWVLPFEDGALTADGTESLLGLDVDGMAIVARRADAEMIAEARTALPACLDRIEELGAQIKACEEVVIEAGITRVKEWKVIEELGRRVAELEMTNGNDWCGKTEDRQG